MRPLLLCRCLFVSQGLNHTTKVTDMNENNVNFDENSDEKQHSRAIRSSMIYQETKKEELFRIKIFIRKI